MILRMGMYNFRFFYKFIPTVWASHRTTTCFQALHSVATATEQTLCIIEREFYQRNVNQSLQPTLPHHLSAKQALPIGRGFQLYMKKSGSGGGAITFVSGNFRASLSTL